MKRKSILAVSVALLLALSLAACGGQADKDYVKWADDNIPKIDKANADYANDYTAAGSDVNAGLAAIDAYLSTMNSIKNSLSALDYDSLSAANKEQYNAQMQQLNEQIAANSAVRGQIEAQFGGGQDYDDDYDDDDDDGEG